jgi:hypothetical protein
MILPGVQEWCFNLGGMNVAFEPASCAFPLAASIRYVGFVGAYPADLTLRLSISAPIMSLGTPNFEAGHWNYYSTTLGDVFRLRIASPGPYFTVYTACLHPDGCRGELYIEEENPASTGQFSYEIPPQALDEVLAIHWITRHDGLILHACGMAEASGGGLLFSGHSGAGKSTIARLWIHSEQAQLLSDERVSVFYRENAFYLHGTPWHGEGLAPSCASAPLQRIFIISHASQNDVHRMLPSDAMLELLSRTLLPFWDQKGIALALDFLNKLCQSVPCYALGFVPDNRVVEYLKCLNE